MRLQKQKGLPLKLCPWVRLASSAKTQTQPLPINICCNNNYLKHGPHVAIFVLNILRSEEQSRWIPIKFEFCDKNMKKDKQNTTYCTLHLHRNPYTHALFSLISTTPLNRFLCIPPKEIKKPNRWKQNKTANVSTRPYTTQKVSMK